MKFVDSAVNEPVGHKAPALSCGFDLGQFVVAFHFLTPWSFDYMAAGRTYVVLRFIAPVTPIFLGLGQSFAEAFFLAFFFAVFVFPAIDIVFGLVFASDPLA